SLRPVWIAIDGEQVKTPETIPPPWEEEVPAELPSFAQLDFLETILAWTLRTEAVTVREFSKMAIILQQDPSITSLVPFLVTALESAAVKLYGPDDRVRMMQLTDAWIRNPHTHTVIKKAYIPRLIAACRRMISRGTV